LFAVAATTALTAAERSSAIAISILGVFITALWALVSQRQLHIMSVVQAEARAAFPEYASLQDRRRATRLRSRHLVAYVLPAMIAIMWVTLLILILGSS
jgi:hypothetical protein